MYLSGHGMLTLILRKILVWLLVALSKLFHNVLAHVAILPLHLAHDLRLILGCHIRHLAVLAHGVEHELSNVVPGDGDVLDCTLNQVSGTPPCGG